LPQAVPLVLRQERLHDLRELLGQTKLAQITQSLLNLKFYFPSFYFFQHLFGFFHIRLFKKDFP